MTISRRKFITGGLVAAGAVAGAAATIGGIGLIRGRQQRGTDGVGGAAVSRLGVDPRAPRYIALAKSGELARREKALWELFEYCRLCPRRCGANRANGMAGACRSGDKFRIASFGPHFGEENVLRGTNGSGTIFFSNCNLLCAFCLNWQINHKGQGQYTTHEELADMMIDLQNRGCHNINFVTPTHMTPHIVKSLGIAVSKGLIIPLVYNSSGFDSLEVIKLLDGIVDIYLPDFKYQDAEHAVRFSKGAQDYPKHAAAAILEMHRQVGHIQTDENGIAYRGVLIRHLILPENLAGTDRFVKWVVQRLGKDAHVNIMSQYRPMFQAHDFPPLDRRPTEQELTQAIRWARTAGLHNFH